MFSNDLIMRIHVPSAKYCFFFCWAQYITTMCRFVNKTFFSTLKVKAASYPTVLFVICTFFTIYLFSSRPEGPVALGH